MSAIIALFMLIGVQQAFAITYTSNKTNPDLTDPADWTKSSGSSAPGNPWATTDTVIIASGHTLSLTANLTVNGVLIINNGGTFSSSKKLLVGNGSNSGQVYNYGTISTSDNVEVKGLDQSPSVIPDYSPRTYPLLINNGTFSAKKIHIGTNGANNVASSGTLVNEINGTMSTVTGQEAHIDGYVHNRGTITIDKVKFHGAEITGCGKWVVNQVDFDQNQDRDGDVDCGNFCTSDGVTEPTYKIGGGGNYSLTGLAGQGTGSSGKVADGTDFTIDSNNTYSCGTSLAGGSWGGLGSDPLPVTLIDFKVEAKEDYHRIFWETATEINNDYFLLEKSVDGIQWNERATVDGQGTSNTYHQYEYLDFQIGNKTTYYRLIQVDYNGGRTFSKIISVEKNNTRKNEVKVYPNPNGGSFYLSSASTNVENVVLRDALGIIVSEIAAKPEENILHFSNLGPGIYFLEITSAEQSEVIKVLVK